MEEPVWEGASKEVRERRGKKAMDKTWEKARKRREKWTGKGHRSRKNMQGGQILQL